MADMFLHVYPVAGIADRRGANQYQKLHSPINTMLTSQIPKSKEEKKMKKHHKGPLPEKAGHWENKRTPITEYIADLTQQIENQYVVHPAWFVTAAAKECEAQRREATGRTSANGWVDSAVENLEDGNVAEKDIELGSVTAGRSILAIDCEMVLSERGEHLLAKITVLNWNGEVVLDELIKPDEPIKDHLSQ
jgi:RNA exonuclease 1